LPLQGKKSYSIYLPEPITTMCALNLERIRNISGLVVALTNGEVI
jgi:hypothetical protein